MSAEVFARSIKKGKCHAINRKMARLFSGLFQPVDYIDRQGGAESLLNLV